MIEHYQKCSKCTAWKMTSKEEDSFSIVQLTSRWDYELVCYKEAHQWKDSSLEGFQDYRRRENRKSTIHGAIAVVSILACLIAIMMAMR